jgi:hypothetical protein
MRPHPLLLSLIIPCTVADHLQDAYLENQETVPTESDYARTGRSGRTRRSTTPELRNLQGSPSGTDVYPQLHHTDCHSGVAARMDSRCGARGSKGVGTAMTEGERSDGESTCFIDRVKCSYMQLLYR